MDFFERQHSAKRATTVLVGMFSLVSAMLVLAIMFVTSQFARFDDTFDAANNLLHPWSLTAGIVTTCIIIVGAFIEWFRLGEGGHALARRMGAKRIFQTSKKHTQDALNSAVSDDAKHVPETASNTAHLELERREKQLLAAVENMAIASGMDMPAVFVLPNEKGINAFVAGFKASDMVLVVTRGALEALDDDELYGIIGHEFSHIAHGDTQLYMRLIILLGGLQLIHEISGLIFGSDYNDDDDYYYDSNRHKQTLKQNDPNRFLYQSEDLVRLEHIQQQHIERRRNGSWGSDIFFGHSASKSDGHGGWLGLAPVIMLFLLAIFFISSLGVFAARIIKYAVLRQREYLADAASMQYTRSFGVLNALKKIRDNTAHSGIYHPSRQALSHLFFASSLPQTDVFNGIFSTHPPLEKRIRALDEREFLRLQQADEIQKAEKIKLAKRQAEARKRFEQERKFELKEASDYDGTPIEFAASGNEPPQLKTKSNSSGFGAMGDAGSMVGVATAVAAGQVLASKALSGRQHDDGALKNSVEADLLMGFEDALPLRTHKQAQKNGTDAALEQQAQPVQKPKPVQKVRAPIKKPELSKHNIAGFERSTKAGRLIHDALSQPKGVLEIIAAALAHHQQRTGVVEVFRPEDYQVSRMLYEAIEQTNQTKSDIALIEAAVDNLPDLSTKVRAPAAKLYLERLRRIISFDGKVSLLEHLLIERVASVFGLFSECIDSVKVQQTHAHAACIKLVHGILKADAHSKEDANLIARRMFRLLGLPSDVAELKPLVSLAKTLNLSQCMSVLSVQSFMDKRNLLNTLKTAMLADGHINEDEAAILKLLEWRLFVDFE